MRLTKRQRDQSALLLKCAAWLFSGKQGGIPTAAYHLGIDRGSVEWVVAVYASYVTPYGKRCEGESLYDFAACKLAEAAALVEEGVLP